MVWREAYLSGRISVLDCKQQLVGGRNCARLSLLGWAQALNSTSTDLCGSGRRARYEGQPSLHPPICVRADLFSRLTFSSKCTFSLN